MSGLLLALSAAWLASAFLYTSYAFVQVRRFGRRLEARPPRAPRQSVVLLRPLHGASPALEECLASLFAAARRAGARVALGVADPDDPARKEAERARERFPDVPSSLAVGEGPPGANPKIRNLVALSRGEGGDVWVLSDADVQVPADYVACFEESLREAGVAAATCPYRSVPGESLGSRLDALVTNASFLPATCAAARLEGVHFALGASVAVRRSALAQAGGIEGLLDEPADDYALARNLERSGQRLAMAPLVVDHVLADGGLAFAWSRHVRWARLHWTARPGGNAGFVAVTHGWLAALATGGAAASLGASPLWCVALPALWWGVAAARVARVRRLLGIRPRDLALLPLADVFGLATALAGLRGRPSPPS